MGMTTLADGTRYETDVQKRGFYRYLDTVGDGTGTKNVIGLYSAAAEEFFVQPAENEVIQITRIMVAIEDAGAFDSGAYGNSVVLTNGITLKEYENGVVVQDLMDGIPVKTNGDWASKCHDFTEHGFGQGNVYGTVRWTFAKAGTNIRLVGALGGKLVLGVNDDFDGLVSHRFMVQGFYESKAE